MIYTVTFNPAIDYVVRLDAPLEVGEVNRAKGEDCVLGGKGINVSGVLAQLGCESVALGFVAGETGAWLERGLAAQGLKTDFVHLEQGMTRINVKIKAGQETELNGAGPDIPESAMQELEKKLDSLNEDDILILAGSIPASLSQDTYERLLARLQGRGVRAVVDATRDLLVNVLQYSSRWARVPLVWWRGLHGRSCPGCAPACGCRSACCWDTLWVPWSSPRWHCASSTATRGQRWQCASPMH